MSLRRTATIAAAATFAAAAIIAGTALPASAAVGITNGGFETGTVAGWTSAGTTSVTTSGPHSGTFGAQVGSTGVTNGDSSIRQIFDAPTGASTRTLLARTCTINQGWKQVTASVIAGHNYTLSLISHDDNFAGDPTFTKYDDVSLNVAANDFSISVNPSSAAVDPGATATATVSTATTAGTAQTVSLSASGLPSGAGAGFNPPSVTSTDSGATWTHGMLPGITVFQGGTFARVSDPSVAFDAKHNTWMITGLVIDANVNGAGVTVSRSTNGGTAWLNPVIAVGNDGQGYDKEW